MHLADFDSSNPFIETQKVSALARAQHPAEMNQRRLNDDADRSAHPNQDRITMVAGRELRQATGHIHPLDPCIAELALS